MGTGRSTYWTLDRLLICYLVRKVEPGIPESTAKHLSAPNRMFCESTTVQPDLLVFGATVRNFDSSMVTVRKIGLCCSVCSMLLSGRLNSFGPQFQIKNFVDLIGSVLVRPTPGVQSDQVPDAGHHRKDVQHIVSVFVCSAHTSRRFAKRGKRSSSISTFHRLSKTRDQCAEPKESRFWPKTGQAHEQLASCNP